MENVPEPIKTALLVQAFLLAFPNISSDSHEVLEQIANGRDLEESFQEYRKKLRKQLPKSLEKGADSVVDELKKELETYYAYIYAPLIDENKPDMRGLARFLLNYTEVLKKVEEAVRRIGNEIMENPDKLSAEELKGVVIEKTLPAFKELKKKNLPLLPLAHFIANLLEDELSTSASLTDAGVNRDKIAEIAQNVRYHLIDHALRLKSQDS